VSGQLQQCTAGGREFKILGDETEKLQALSVVCVKGTVSRLILDELRERAAV